MNENLKTALPLVDRMPPANGGVGCGHVTGLDSGSDVSPSILTSLVDAASSQNNEFKPNDSIT